jgi:hypothetical protein
MKQIILLLSTGFFLSFQPTFGQPQPAPQQTPAGLPPRTAGVSAPGSTPGPELTRFDLNFPGGTPRELVEAIEKSSGKPLNAIIPDELAKMRLPALKMNAVTAPQLFDALGAASRKTEAYTYQSGLGRPPGQELMTTSYGFRTYGTLGDDAIWHFYYDRPNRPDPPQEPKACRFYQLGPYLDTYKIEDITTAIETGWKMLGETERPEIKFHKDTKLLIAVGEPSKLVLIESVLAQLKQEKSMETKRRDAFPEVKSGDNNAKP